ncbi:hypothetical protein Q2P59_003428 [Escherichia coli]|nr:MULTISPECIES: hypothetical protein [Enterobacterales]ELM8267048.1 hypothetical protein [Escherichia coli]ELM8361115.1 hypothetical protein [Escherichia coli]UII03287.1 hypothetical protein NIFDCIIE_00045 [Klebsiella quasipneumoniae subsp. similipneumoniae]
MLILKLSTNQNGGGNPASLEGINTMDKGTLEMYEKEYEIYFDSLKEGDEVLSLKEYIECLTWKKKEDEK